MSLQGYFSSPLQVGRFSMPMKMENFALVFKKMKEGECGGTEVQTVSPPFSRIQSYEGEEQPAQSWNEVYEEFH